MDGPRLVLLLFLIIFLLLSPDGHRATPIQQRELDKLIGTERSDLDILNSTRSGDFDPTNNKWLNITGLREKDGYAWDLLPLVQARVREQAEAVLKPWTNVPLGDRYTSVDNLDGSSTSDNDPLNRPVVPFFKNVTGLVRGKWVRSATVRTRQPPALNLTALSPIPYPTKEYTRNITGSGGDLTIKLDEKKSKVIYNGQNSAREIKAEMTVKDESSSGDGWDMTMYGVHFPESGHAILSTTGDRFGGIFGLPHYSRSRPTFELSQKLLNGTLSATIDRQEKSIMFPSYPWASSPGNPSEIMFPTPHCEYILYLQQHVVFPYKSNSPQSVFGTHPSELEKLEQELRFPTGARYDVVPELSFTALIYSPDCGFVLESMGPPDFALQDGMHLKGPKAEAYYGSVKQAVQMFALLIVGQIYLLVRQMKDASTPSTRSRISFYTIAIMALGDGFFCLSFMTLSLLMDATFLIVVSTAFLAFLSVSFFGMKFLMDIWSVQAPERLERDRERERQQVNSAATNTAGSASTTAVPANNAPSTPTPAVIITPAGADTLPLPVTARRPIDTGATPIIITPDQEVEMAATEDEAAAAIGTAQTITATTPDGTRSRDLRAMYFKFYFLLVSVLFLSLNATTWPTAIRHAYTNTVAFLYLSIWAPQIKRNIVRNCRKALRWEFVIGQSIFRFIPFVYFYAVPNNVLFSRSDRHTLYVLAGWLWIQVWVLVSQEILGPRMFIPNGWAPPAYDYHPILREDADEESGASMPIGFTQATNDGDFATTTPGESKVHGQKVFDCAICMQTIDVPVVPAGGAGDGESGSSPSLGTGIFSRRAYMVTPCRHIFHSVCLEGWMRYKLQCPICRESLPPL